MSMQAVVAPRWADDPDGLAGRFAGADPFPHLVMDDFLLPEVARGLHAAFPSIEAMPRSRDYVFANKHELSSLGSRAKADRAFRDAMLSPDFADWLSRVTGETVFVDPDFHGGGFHQGGDGSFLDMHVDFNVHPVHPTWLRRANLLVYLTPEWDPDVHGGHLEIRAGADGDMHRIAPRFNRAVLMRTDDRTYHGYRRMSLPHGVARRSIATYAYRELAVDDEIRVRTTEWRPEAAGTVKTLLARNWNGLVALKNRFLGSGTTRNR